jgi:hypothetical protein
MNLLVSQWPLWYKQEFAISHCGEITSFLFGLDTDDIPSVSDCQRLTYSVDNSVFNQADAHIFGLQRVGRLCFGTSVTHSCR